MDVADIYYACRLAQQKDGFGGGGDLVDPTTWGAWAHKGHRLWASMSEDFWMYVYKVRLCPQPCNHTWATCPYAHKGEPVRRRDPRRFRYVATPCPDYRKQDKAQLAGGGGQPPPTGCRYGLKCRYTHSIYEQWLHPSRFRTRMCAASPDCTRRICFFAHLTTELRSDDHSAAAAAGPAAAAAIMPPRMISLQRFPPSILQRALSPPPASPPPVAISSYQLFDDAPNRLSLLRLYSACAADTVFSSAATSAAATPATPAAATVPMLVASPDGGGEEVKCGRCGEKEDYSKGWTPW